MRHRRTWGGRKYAVVALALCLSFALLPANGAGAESIAPAPINDNYLSSLNINEPGTPLNRVDTITDTRDTSSATVQGDIFSPPEHGGPPEVTGCNGVSEGKTIWYDFYPDANGLVRVRTSAQFGTVMAVMPYDPKSLRPEIGHRECAINVPTQAHELFVEVHAGRLYTVQLGGVNSAGGELEFLFDYLVRPKHIQAEAALSYVPLASGVRVKSLSVGTPRGAHVTVRCSRACPAQTRNGPRASFPRLRGALLRNGMALKIYVTAKNETGVFIEYKVRGGNVDKSRFCLPPGSMRPAACE